MSTGKIFCMIFALVIALSSPLPGLAEAREEQAPPEEAVHGGGAWFAGIITAINIPSRVVLCGIGAGMGFIVMGASAGRRYAQAAKIMEEGCAGPWVITPQMLGEERLGPQDHNGGVAGGYGQP